MPYVVVHTETHFQFSAYQVQPWMTFSSLLLLTWHIFTLEILSLVCLLHYLVHKSLPNGILEMEGSLETTYYIRLILQARKWKHWGWGTCLRFHILRASTWLFYHMLPDLPSAVFPVCDLCADPQFLFILSKFKWHNIFFQTGENYWFPHVNVFCGILQQTWLTSWCYLVNFTIYKHYLPKPKSLNKTMHSHEMLTDQVDIISSVWFKC